MQPGLNWSDGGTELGTTFSNPSRKGDLRDTSEPVNKFARRVCILDDDVSILTSVSRLAQPRGCEVVGFTELSGFLAQDHPEVPTCLVAEPATAGSALQSRLREVPGAMPVVFLSKAPEVAEAVRAMKAGAVDYLIKPCPDAQLMEAIEEGIRRHALELRELGVVSELRERYGRLTAREREVCLAVGRGMLNKQIAALLGMAEKTVKVHRSRVMWKLRVDSLPHLVLLLHRIGAVQGL